MICKTNQVHQQDQAVNSTKTSANIRLLLWNEINNWQINWLLYTNLLAPFARSQKSLHKHIVSNSGCKLTVAIFWTKFAQDRYLYSKTEKVNFIIEFWLFKSALVPNFSLNWQFWFFWPEGVFLVWNRKSGHHIFCT